MKKLSQKRIDVYDIGDGLTLKQERKRKNASDYNIYRNRGKWICLCRKCK